MKMLILMRMIMTTTVTISPTSDRWPPSSFPSGLGLGDTAVQGPDWMGWLIFGSALWAVWAFVEQQTVALMMVVKSSYSAAAASIALTTFYLLVASATLRWVCWVDFQDKSDFTWFSIKYLLIFLLGCKKLMEDIVPGKSRAKIIQILTLKW